jgi:hypothetical protein
MDTDRRTRSAFAAGLTAVVLTACATTAATPSGSPGDGPASELTETEPGTGDWKDLITEEPASGTSGDGEVGLLCDGEARTTSPPRAC